MSEIKRIQPFKYRTIFVSDLHLGTRSCQAESLLDFLQSTSCKQLYLVGDIVDIWSMRNRLYWPESHNAVILELLQKVRSGTRVVYVPGNHDELLRGYLGTDIAGVEIRQDPIHLTADGRRLLVLHGDRFDSIVQHSPWLARFGAAAYDNLLALNGLLGRTQRRLGLRYWSLAGYLKRKVKNAVSYIGRFEQAVVGEALGRGVDGMICGHIHHAEMRDMTGVLYCNCGDWVESCTALVEHRDGRLELLRWTAEFPETVAGPIAAPELAQAQAV